MRSLNLDQLRALEAVVAGASFTGAARQLNLSQSAVSVQIRELEDRLGVRLVERLGKKAYATAAGREVIEHARRISAETDAIATAMRRLRDGWIGRVHVGSTLTALMYLLPPVLKKLHTAHPGIDLLVTNSPTSRMVEGVLHNEMDIGLVTLPVEDSRLAITPLRVEPMVAILPAPTRQVPKEITPDYVASAVPGARDRRRQRARPALVIGRSPATAASVDARERGRSGEGCRRRRARHGGRTGDVGHPPERRHHRPAAQSAADPDARAHPSPQQAGRSRVPDRARRDDGIVEHSRRARRGRRHRPSSV